MVEFATFFLGLLLGPQPLELNVSPEVATVEIVLDSRPVGTLRGEPWEMVCDLGPRLAPHELVAVARDREGREVARARQWLNLPTRRAEARFVFEDESPGQPSRARLIWQALDHDRPERVTVRLDGRVLPTASLDAIELPAYDPDQIHVLSAELEFSETTHATAEVVFGGVYGDRVASELTALVLESDRRRLPRPEALEGRLTAASRPLRVVAVERGPLDLLVVREEAAATFAGLERLASIGGGQRIPRRLLLPEILAPHDRLRFVFPSQDSSDRNPSFDLMPVSGDVAPAETEPLFNLLTGISFGEHDRALPSQRLADSVAVAGLLAAKADRRRAVLLVTSGESADASRLAPAVVRDYLNSLMVPLTVWSFADPETAEAVTAWGAASGIAEWSGLVKAFRSLEQSLASQIVVWVEGRHLPQQVVLDPAIEGLRLARRQTVELDERLAALPASPPAPPPAASDPASAPAAAAGERRFALGDTQRRIERARAVLGDRLVAGRVGPFDLLTDHFSPRLLKSLDRLAREAPRLYAEHHGLAAAGSAGGTVILFANEDDYRSLEPGSGDGGLELAGHAAPGVVTLYAGRRRSRAVEATFVHELTHLLNHQALGPELPVWLDEGLAEEMALACIRPRGDLAFVPLDARALVRGNRLELYGPLTVLGELLEALDTGDLPPLPALMELDRESFRRSRSRRLLYALYAFWVHYLATADAETAAGFRDYLNAVAAGGGAAGVSLTATLGRGWEELEPAFHGWLRSLDERLRPPLD